MMILLDLLSGFAELILPNLFMHFCELVVIAKCWIFASRSRIHFLAVLLLHFIF